MKKEFNAKIYSDCPQKKSFDLNSIENIWTCGLVFYQFQSMNLRYLSGGSEMIAFFALLCQYFYIERTSPNT